MNTFKGSNKGLILSSSIPQSRHEQEIKLPMKISFNSKEESNEIQRKEFLDLSPGERFEAWLILMHRAKSLITTLEPEKGNFMVIIKSK